MKKVLTLLGLFVILVTFSGCYGEASDDEQDLRTIPVTNNPHVIPNYGGSTLPGMPSKGSPQ